MPVIFRRLSAISVIAAAAVGVAACGSSSSSSTASSSVAAKSSSMTTTATSASAPATVVGHSTVVTVNPATTAELKKAGITVAAVAPATTKTHNTIITFPANGGQIVVATVVGTVDDNGGLTFSHNGKSVKLTSFIVDTSTKQLTAELGAQRVAIFELNLASLKRASGPHGTVVASDIKLTVTSQAASDLNSGLGVSTFKGGQNFGIVTLTVAVKA
jgi:hypothetical protein